MCGILVCTDLSISRDRFDQGLRTMADRGPDMERTWIVGHGFMGFRRLAIMDISEEGMQPFGDGSLAAVCNGEIYGFRKQKEEFPDYPWISTSDCELLIPMFRKYGLDMFAKLDAEFACALYSEKYGWVAARDPIGIRPLFYGYTVSGKICFGSSVASLMPFAVDIKAFPPGHYYCDGKFVSFNDIWKPEGVIHDDLETACGHIHDLLIEGVKKRMDSDAPIGYLLSGGLDSSLVCAIAQKYTNHPIKTFAIGMDFDPIDLKYAREVADYIGSDHQEFLMSREEVLAALPEVIKALGSYDITTVRASMGMYLLCKHIHEESDCKVLLTGEVSDELFGYKYTDYAPDAQSFQLEAEKRVRELYVYDVLRADRCIAAASMESRVPFGDLAFVKYVMALDPELKMNTYGKGKYLLRHAFAKDDLLPENILMREKAAFSDAVGHSLVDDLKAYAEEKYTDGDLAKAAQKYPYCTPFTKESLLYRDIFEEYYPGMSGLIPAFWMPNQSWEGCDVKDPSARYLANYGDSAN